MPKKTTVCPCCGRKITEYKHLMNANLTKDLKVLESVGGRATLKDLTSEGLLTYSEAANFQKLRYFGLVEKEGHIYAMTPKGKAFVNGTGPSPSYVTTVNANAVSFGPDIVISEITTPYQPREDFEEQAQT